MSFHFIAGAGGTALASDRALVRAADRQALTDAAALVSEARRLRDAAAVEIAAARDAARAEALAEASAAAHAVVAELVAALTREHAEAEARRERDIARLALAAVEQMLGRLDPAAATAALAAQAAGSIPGARVRVAPAMAQAVSARLGDSSATVAADPALAPLEIRLEGSEGEVVADAAVQLARLGERWGLAADRLAAAG